MSVPKAKMPPSAAPRVYPVAGAGTSKVIADAVAKTNGVEPVLSSRTASRLRVPPSTVCERVNWQSSSSVAPASSGTSTALLTSLLSSVVKVKGGGVVGPGVGPASYADFRPTFAGLRLAMPANVKEREVPLPGQE